MEARPKIKLILSPTDKLLEVLGWFTVLLLWTLVTLYYTKLPNIIPKHFNLAGKIDDYGNKSSIIISSIIGTVVFVGCTFLNKFPETFNYVVKITKENAEKQYINATRMIRYLKLIMVFISLFIQYQTIQVAMNKSTVLSFWFLPLVLGIFGILGYFGSKSIKYK